jgi:hypothetical protein
MGSKYEEEVLVLIGLRRVVQRAGRDGDQLLPEIPSVEGVFLFWEKTLRRNVLAGSTGGIAHVTGLCHLSL